MSHVTDEILNAAIERMGSTFDSHDVIFAIMRSAPRAYAADLAATAGDDPFVHYHATIGSRLKSFDQIEATRKIISRNVRGEDSENQEWRKKR